LRSAHLAGFAARPLPVRARGRSARTPARVRLADAARPLRGADRAVAAHTSDRPCPTPRAGLLDPHGPARRCPMTPTKTTKTKCRLKTSVALLAIALQLAAQVGPAAAFCGFYVAKADAKLFNKSSKVVLARNGTTTAITMASDYEGEPKEFAVVIPVPTFIERKQIGVVEPKTVDHIDAYTAPRLVEDHDQDPGPPMVMSRVSAGPLSYVAAAVPAPPVNKAAAYGVTIEASYDVAEYDVLILSAKESNGLESWLTDNGYKIPQGAAAVLASYIKQNMRFFVAKVNVQRMQLGGAKNLRPLQVRYESAKFMLPLRLGTVNANGPQDLIIYALSRKGRVEASNYRTVKLPSDIDVPLYVKDEFGKFYTAMFDQAVREQDMRAVFTEYAWDMGWCDPCASNPLSSHEMVELGARWIGSDDSGPYRSGPYGGGTDAYVTRLHVRYDAAHFPEDLALLETKDRENFQGRYVLRHPWRGAARCSRGIEYRNALQQRFKDEAKNLATLTGWPEREIRQRMVASGQLIWSK